MRNFGLEQLVLVDPIASTESMEAVMMATHGLSVLKSARRVSTLAEAVADCGFVLATSGEIGGLTRKGYWGTPEDRVPALLDAMDRTPVAIVLGPEPSGLTVEEISSCHGMMYVPCAEEYPSLNLAQAVGICLYELRKQWLKRQPVEVPLEAPATYVEQEHLFAHLKKALTDVRFLWDFRSDGIFHVLRHDIVRGLPTSKEIRLWHGLARQLEYIARRYGITHPRAGRAPKQDAAAAPALPESDDSEPSQSQDFT